MPRNDSAQSFAATRSIAGGQAFGSPDLRHRAHQQPADAAAEQSLRGIRLEHDAKAEPHDERAEFRRGEERDMARVVIEAVEAGGGVHDERSIGFQNPSQLGQQRPVLFEREVIDDLIQRGTTNRHVGEGEALASLPEARVREGMPAPALRHRSVGRLEPDGGDPELTGALDEKSVAAADVQQRRRGSVADRLRQQMAIVTPRAVIVLLPGTDATSR